MRRADRLFQIIQILRRSARPVTAASLAAELEVCTRTVYRDIASLIGQRVPITGEAGFGYVLAAEYDMPPLMLTPPELEAIVLGMQWVAGRDDPQLSPAARDVLAKVAVIIPERLRSFIADPGTAARPTLAAVRERVDLAVLRDAIRRRSKLRLVYADARGGTTDRTVWPILLGYAEAERVLIAWCELRGDFRLFRTDRMQSVERLDQPIGERRAHLLRRWETARLAQLSGPSGGPAAAV